jgi:hypothetical protein
VTITLPHELTEPLSWIGMVWPEADEDQLYADGRAWVDYGSKLRAHAEQGNTAARQVWTDNYGESIDAFEQWWNGEGPGHHLDNAATAVELIGGALIAMAGITVALKLGYIGQLAALAIEVAQAVATAVVSFGATLAEVPGWIALTRTACRALVDKALAMVEKEVAALLKRAATLLEKAGARDLSAKALSASESTAFKGLMHEVELADVRSPLNGANFYSGKDPANVSMRVYAEAHVDGTTSVTLEQTPGGKYFDGKHLYETGSPVNIGQADQVWARLSQRYAENAEGEVTAWTHNPRVNSIWNTVERPALEDNPKVTGINVIDPVP